MNAKQRLFARIKGEPVDRIPNLNIIMLFAAREIGVPYSRYCQDHRLMAEGNIACAEKYKLDCVTVMSDPMREAHDLGTDVVFPEDDVPYAQHLLLEDKSALHTLSPILPENGKRMSETLKTIRFYKDTLGDDYPIIGWVEGCFAEAADLRGVSEFLVDLYDDRAFATDLLELCCEQAILYAQAQIDAGADIIGVGDAISSVAGPKLYEELAGDYQRRILAAIKKAGAKTKLHICGNIEPFLQHIPVDVVDVLDVDWMVSLEKAVETCKEHTALSGNYDPVSILLQGNEQTIANAVHHCIDIASSTYISAAGCEVPKHTPPANLLAVHNALMEHAQTNNHS